MAFLESLSLCSPASLVPSPSFSLKSLRSPSSAELSLASLRPSPRTSTSRIRVLPAPRAEAFSGDDVDAFRGSSPELKQASSTPPKAPQNPSPKNPSSRAPGVSGRATRGRTRNGSATTVGGGGEEEAKKEKKEKLRQALANINKRFGPGTCLPANEVNAANLETNSTGILPLDLALGGGWPKGKVVEIFGNESTGKTTIALYAIAEVQKAGNFACFIDAEHSLNREYAERLGVRWDDSLSVSQPKSGEEALDLTDMLMQSGEVDLVVVDSVSALVPQAELDGTLGEGSLGQLSRLMSSGLRKLQGTASRTKTTLIFLNQVRNTIGGYGNPETTSGGKALKFAAFLRCQVTAADRKKSATGDVSYTCRVRLAKSKMGNPGSVVEFEMRIGEGVPRESALLTVGEKLGLVNRKGAWYYMDGGNFHGTEKAVEYLVDNPEFTKDLEVQVRAKVGEAKGLPPGTEAYADEDDDDVDDDFEDEGFSSGDSVV